jgi:hypothetical protein
MRRATFTRILSISLLLLPQSARAGDAIDDALEQVEDAIARVREEGGRCKRAALGPLEDAQAALESAGKKSRKKAVAKADRALRSALDEADDCPKKILKQLRQAREALEDEDDDDAKGDDDAQPRAAKRNPSVPYADSARDCQDLWFMHRFTTTTSNEARALELINSLSEVVCRSGQDLSGHSWPNGQVAKYPSGEWHYLNGQTAKYASGEWHYPNGQTAKYASGEWHYPSGQTAKYASGEWHYPNGQVAGDWKALLAWACGRLGKSACDAVHREFDSDIDDWRDYALVDLAYRAGRAR